MNLANPFSPGAPHPPLLAGRDRELALLARKAGTLASGSDAPDAIVHGPRGNGKTSLLNHFATDPDRTKGVRVVFVSASQIRSGFEVYERVTGGERATSTERTVLRKAGLSTPIGGGEIAKETRERVERARLDLTDLLDAVCQERNVMLIVDEAQALDVGLGHELLNASQNLKRRRRPFCLVVAGTPGLLTHLGRMDATFFIDRSEELPIGRLTTTDATTALVQPFATADYTLPDQSLAFADVVERLQDYPFFVQLMGSSLWEEAQAAGSTKYIEEATVRRAMTAFERQVRMMYRRRHAELDEARLDDAASAIAQRMVESGLDTLSKRDALDAISSHTDDAASALEKLRNLGFVWNPTSVSQYEPGIPSLMHYLNDEARGK